MNWTACAAIIACVLASACNADNDAVSLLQAHVAAIDDDKAEDDKDKSTNCHWGNWDFITGLDPGSHVGIGPYKSDIVGIKKGPNTESGMTELHILTAASDYQSFALQAGTALPYTDGTAEPYTHDNWAFTMNANGDLVAIKKGPLTGSGSTELHILSRTSNYQSWVLQTGTPLHYTDDNWAFTMRVNGDLVAIKKGPSTDSGTTELHILSASSNYQSWVSQTGTALHYTDDNWAFGMKANGDLVGILKGPSTGSGMTEVHILSAASNYQEWVLQTGTALHYTDDNWAFAVRSDGDVMAILKGPTSGSGTTEAHVLSSSSDYGSFSLQTGTALHYTVCAPPPTTTTTTQLEQWPETTSGGICSKGWIHGHKSEPPLECQQGCASEDKCQFYCHSTSNPHWDCLRYTKCPGLKTEHEGVDVSDYKCYEKV